MNSPKVGPSRVAIRESTIRGQGSSHPQLDHVETLKGHFGRVTLNPYFIQTLHMGMKNH
jgi:hypothetical protein